MQFEHPFCRAKRRFAQRGIESLAGEWPKRAIEDLPLPEGEGWGEGEAHAIMNRHAISFPTDNPPSTESFWLRKARQHFLFSQAR